LHALSWLPQPSPLRNLHHGTKTLLDGEHCPATTHERGEQAMKKNNAPKFASKLEFGDQVVMHSCREALKHGGKVWTVKSEPWDLCGSEVVKLEGFSGGFATEFLQKVDVPQS
jgi:hypothetical protein